MASPNINFTIHLIPEDYIKATRLHIRPRPIFKWVGYFLILLAVFVLGVSFYFAVFHGESFLPSILIMACLIYLAFIFLFLYPRRIRKIFRQQKSLQSLHLYTAMDEAIHIKSPTGEEKLPWDHFTKWKEGKNLFVLYLSDALFHIIPKRFFASPEDMAQFRQLLQTKLGPAGI